MKAVEVESVTKIYGEGTMAVNNVSFSVDEGEIFGLLGPNGAGKTTIIKMLTTLTKPTSGSVRVLGIDSLISPREVRRVLGYVPQAVSADGDLTGYENLLIFAKLFHVNKAQREGRIKEALELMNLQDRTNDLVKHYSGGMMRRLEIAQTLVNRPKLLFLDEPSIGLDPSSRIQVWSYVKKLNRDYGTTIIITTHDMEEADELCHRLAIMNAGALAVCGPPEELKKSVGIDLITVRIKSGRPPLSLPREIGTLLNVENVTLKIQTANGEGEIAPIVDFLEKNDVTIDSISLTRPTLGDVFLKYGGTASLESGSVQNVRSARQSFARHGGGS